MNCMKQLGMVGFTIGLLFTTAIAMAAPVNINTADAKTLAENIKGIGPKKAQAIVVYRRDNGPFKSLHDLIKVKGIGEKFIDKHKAELLLSDATLKKSAK